MITFTVLYYILNKRYNICTTQNYYIIYNQSVKLLLDIIYYFL